MSTPSPEIEYTLDPTWNGSNAIQPISVGDTFFVHLRVVHDEKAQALLPSQQKIENESFGELFESRTALLTKAQAHKVETKWIFQFRALYPGKNELPKPELTIRNADGSQTPYQVPTLTLEIQSHLNESELFAPGKQGSETQTQEQVQKLLAQLDENLEPEMQYQPNFLIISGFAFLILLIVLVFFFIKRKKHQSIQVTATTQTPSERALNALQTIEQELKTNGLASKNAAKSYQELSWILRNFLSEYYKAPTLLDSTSEEVLDFFHKSSDDLLELQKLLLTSDYVKFAKRSGQVDELLELIQDTKHFILTRTQNQATSLKFEETHHDKA